MLEIKLSALRYLDSILTDRFVSTAVLALTLSYVVIFGIFNFSTIYAIPLDSSALIILIPIFLIDSLKSLVESFNAGALPIPVEDVKNVTAIIPTYNGQKKIRQTLRSLLKKLPKANIIVAVNGSTDQSVAIARALGVRVIEYKDPVGKVHAINLALEYVSTKYTLILDDDTLTARSKFPTNLLEQGYEGVAFRVLPIKAGWLSTLQAYEYRKSMDIGRAFHNRSATVQSISGAIGLFRTEELVRQIKLHSREFSGEDLQRTLLIHQLKNKKGVVIADSTVKTRVPGTIQELFSQRVYGWYPGFYANIGIYFNFIFQKNIPFRLRVEAIYNSVFVFLLDPVRAVSLPVLLFSPTFLVLFFVTYVLVEMVPYLRLGRKDPIWVLFAAPFYGLFNFIARFISGSAFMYRRLSYKIGHATFYDEYKYVRKYAKLYGSAITILVYFLFFSVYAYLAVLPSETKSELDAKIKSIEVTKIIRH